jgi:hypothetical protein
MRQRKCFRKLVAAFAVAGIAAVQAISSPARAEGPNAIVTVPSATSGDACLDNVLPANDDGSTGVIPVPFTLNFFGVTYGALFVNNNGNVTFDGPLGTYTPFPLLSTSTPIIAPFFADVDTRGTGSSPVTYSFGTGSFGGRPAFCVDWVNVGYFGGHTDKLNSFQLLLVDRSDVQVGDFDIVMNYDKIQWESGDASGGVDGLGGVSARVGFANGIDQAFELPGSSVNGSFLDANPDTGLIHNSRDSVQLGRYIFPVRNGAPPAGGSISGTVYANSVAPANVLGGAYVQACPTSGPCHVTATTDSGTYSMVGVPPGPYTVRAFPPASSTLFPGTTGPVTVVADEDVQADVVLTGPQPLPADTTITSRYVTPDGLPVVYWNEPLTLTTTGCAGGSASYAVTLDASVVRSGNMAEGPAGQFTATIEPLYPNHGNAHVAITIACPGGGTTDVAFDMYIDPSGTVRTIAGDPIADATVTLLRSDTATGPFTAVPDGSGIMSPVNRANPDVTDAEGHFGWDVVAGFYKVRAERAGCVDPADPAQAFVESAVLTIPPPVTDLDLRLDCAVSQSIDHPQATHKLLLQETASGARKLLWVTSKSPGAASASVPPTVSGATLTITNPATAETASASLPAGNWVANGPGTVFKFKNKGAPAGPSVVKSALFKSGGILKVSAKDTLITLDEASQGSLEVRLDIGDDRYCARCDAPAVDTAGKYSATNCTALPECP